MRALILLIGFVFILPHKTFAQNAMISGTVTTAVICSIRKLPVLSEIAATFDNLTDAPSIAVPAVVTVPLIIAF